MNNTFCVKCGGLSGAPKKNVRQVILNENGDAEKNMRLLQAVLSKVLSGESEIPKEFYCACKIGGK